MDDLLAVDSVLVSAGFNVNDHFFDPAELDRAAFSPRNKPANRDHVQADVVGHISDSAKLKETPLGPLELSARILVYTYFARDQARQADATAFASELIEPLPESPWCVSMECSFNGFDYALLVDGGDPLDPTASTIVPRTPSTDFLTKHLKRYGGSGSYGGQRIGQVLRNVHFTGVGFTRNPANSRSVLTGVGPVYAGASISPSEPEQIPMSVKTDPAADAAAAQTKLTETEAKLVSATAERDAKAAELAAALAEAAEASSALAAKVAELALSEDRAKVAEAAIAATAAEAAFAERVTKVAEAYSCKPEAAVAAATPLKGLSDDAFAAHLEAMKSLRAAAPKAVEKAAVEVASAAVAASVAEPVAETTAVAAADKTKQSALAAELAAWRKPAAKAAK